MATDLIRYDLLVQDALRGVVRKVLTDAARDGLPGEHHFFITFKTHFPGLQLSQAMRDQYPEEMTIILQHQFWGLKVMDEGFEVGLSFKNIPETLYIPYEAMTGFFDPSVQFGLKFDIDLAHEEEAEDAELEAPSDREPETIIGLLPGAQGEAEPEAESSKVVSIDAFRKKT